MINQVKRKISQKFHVLRVKPFQIFFTRMFACLFRFCQVGRRLLNFLGKLLVFMKIIYNESKHELMTSFSSIQTWIQEFQSSHTKIYLYGYNNSFWFYYCWDNISNIWEKFCFSFFLFFCNCYFQSVYLNENMQ